MAIPRSDADPHVPADGEGMPRWVKVFAIAALAALVMLALVMMVSGGSYGPGRHLRPGTPAGEPAPATGSG